MEEDNNVDVTLGERLSDGSAWRRLLYMVLFVIIFNVAELVLYVLITVQFLFRLISGQTVERSRAFGGELAAYVREIIAFLTYHTETTPYPFGPWPAAGADEEQPAPEPPAEIAAPAKPKRAARPRRGTKKATDETQGGDKKT